VLDADLHDVDFQSGFDEERARQDSLRTLWGMAIRGAIEEGCTRFDMLLGEQRYKLDWGVTEVRRLHGARLYNATPAGRARRGRDEVVRRWRESRPPA
jgi:CelD/BcsL family acetyltransferase involved in cellulose biosynthesis